MKDSYLDILEEATNEWRKDETFERALSRAVKKKDKEFEDYIEIIGEVRDRAHKEDVDLQQAAELILEK